MKRAIKDLWYILAIWAIMRLSPNLAGEILEGWGKRLQITFRK